MNRPFRKFLRLAIGGRRIGDRCEVFRAFLRRNIRALNPEYTEEQIIACAEQHFVAYRDDPPNAESVRTALQAFQTQRRAQKAKSARRRAPRPGGQKNLCTSRRTENENRSD
jgi:hypothetical protein